MQSIANKSTNGDVAKLVNSMNDLFVSVSEELPRLQPSHPVFDVREPIPAEFLIDVACTQTALAKVKCNKANGPDNIPPCMLNNLLAAPITAILNSSRREGIITELWKTATVIPLPNKRPPLPLPLIHWKMIVHFNNLQTQCPMHKCVDDITVFDICIDDRVSMLQQSVDVITNWARDNAMRVNTKKTKEMMICFCRDETPVTATPTVVIDGNTIERMTQAKVLGVTISADLS